MTRKKAISEALGGGTSAISPKNIGFPGVVKRKGLSAPVDVGNQLSRRVSSGAISQTQAERTARQRKLLQRAYGADWREQVFGKGGAEGIGGPFGLSRVRTKRVKALERARTKVRGNGGTYAQ